jgi:hypothetical protein
MILNSQNVLLFIEPRNGKSTQPVNDDITVFIETLLNTAMNTDSKAGAILGNGSFVKGLSTMGVHTCCCGKSSESCDYEIHTGYFTNSLAAHYLRWHRSEVPAEELNKVRSLMRMLDR